MLLSTNSNHSQDVYYMSLAIAEAKKGIYTTRPNPTVGCVLVKDDTVIGRGFHPKVGESHAEIFALQSARKDGYEVSGATAYVTLEPCSHYGRTPPCAKAFIDVGIKRVVVAGLDPNPKVAGRGVAMLEQAGIEVCVGVLTEQAEAVNKGFLKAMRTGMPYVRLKIATSLDGRTAMASGESKWITSNEAREDVQRLRALSGAIITGSQTIIDDNPSLNVRSLLLGVDVSSIPKPTVVVLDRRQRLHCNTSYQVMTRDNTLLWCDDDLEVLLRTLVSEHKIYDILIEAGASVAGSFIASGLIDELIVYQAPCILGSIARPMLNMSIEKLNQQYRFELAEHQKIGQDLKMVFLRP